jgi:predicted SnoaL-like aldol condensation-catalyzing enzyme
MSAKNRTLVSQIVEELWNKKNPAVIGQLYAENYVGHTPDGVLQGHAGARQHYDTYVAAFPDCKIAIDGMVAEGDTVSVRWTATERTGANSLASHRPASGSPCQGTSRSASPAARLSKTTTFGTP